MYGLAPGGPRSARPVARRPARAVGAACSPLEERPGRRGPRERVQSWGRGLEPGDPGLANPDRSSTAPAPVPSRRATHAGRAGRLLTGSGVCPPGRALVRRARRLPSWHRACRAGAALAGQAAHLPAKLRTCRLPRPFARRCHLFACQNHLFAGKTQPLVPPGYPFVCRAAHSPAAPPVPSPAAPTCSPPPPFRRPDHPFRFLRHLLVQEWNHPAGKNAALFRRAHVPSFPDDPLVCPATRSLFRGGP
jgi:hypothetical protein